MAKIVGVFKVVFQNSKTTETASQDLIIMENLFYNRQINKVDDDGDDGDDSDRDGYDDDFDGGGDVLMAMMMY